MKNSPLKLSFPQALSGGYRLGNPFLRLVCHSNFKKYFLLLFFIFFSNTSIYSQEINYEQIALEYFLNNLYNENLFENECTGLKFDDNFNIDVYDSSSFDIFCEVYPELIFSIPNDSITPREKGKLCKDFRNGNQGPAKLDLNLSIDKKLNGTSIKEAPYETEIFYDDSVYKQRILNSYLLRFSYRYKYNSFTFVALSIKKSYHSAEVNFLLKFKNDEIVNFERVVFSR